VINNTPIAVIRPIAKKTYLSDTVPIVVETVAAGGINLLTKAANLTVQPAGVYSLYHWL